MEKHYSSLIWKDILLENEKSDGHPYGRGRASGYASGPPPALQTA